MRLSWQGWDGLQRRGGRYLQKGEKTYRILGQEDGERRGWAHGVTERLPRQGGGGVAVSGLSPRPLPSPQLHVVRGPGVAGPELAPTVLHTPRPLFSQGSEATQTGPSSPYPLGFPRAHAQPCSGSGTHALLSKGVDLGKVIPLPRVGNVRTSWAPRDSDPLRRERAQKGKVTARVTQRGPPNRLSQIQRVRSLGAPLTPLASSGLLRMQPALEMREPGAPPRSPASGLSLPHVHALQEVQACSQPRRCSPPQECSASVYPLLQEYSL